MGETPLALASPFGRRPRQQGGLVPIVEPEVLMDGDHTIKRCYVVTEEVLQTVFNELRLQNAYLNSVDV